MRMREDRRCLSSSCVGLGRGDRDRDADLELCPDLADLTGIWMLLDRRRETADPPEFDQEIGGELTLGGGFLGLVVSEVGEPLMICLSLGRVCCRRSEAGLDEVDAVGGPGNGDNGLAHENPELLSTILRTHVDEKHRGEDTPARPRTHRRS